MQEKQIVVDGLITKYSQVGDGKVVILLHGWGDDLTTFARVQLSLATEYSAVALDLPGFGGTQSPKGSWTLDDYANFVGAFIAKKGFKPLAVIGHSNGGAIAVRGVASGILKPKKLILLASSGVRDQYKGKKKALRIVAKVGKLAVAPLPKSTRNKLKRSAYKTVGSDLFVAEHLQETFKNIITDDVQEDAKKISIPTLLVYGLNDAATPPDYGKLLSSKITGSRLNVIEDAGHFVHHDATNEVNQLVKLFLGGTT